MWKIEKIISKGDYNYAIVRNHPNRTKKSYVLEHRVVVENHLGRLLEPDEIVHHINGNKKDNRIENLEVMKQREHATHHAQEKGRLYYELYCNNCGIIFIKSANNLDHRMKNEHCPVFCSRKCCGLLSRKRYLSGESIPLRPKLIRKFRRYLGSDREENIIIY